MTVCEHSSAHVTVVAGNPRIQWNVIEDEGLPAMPGQSGLQAFGAESLATTDKVKAFLQAGPSGPGGGRKLPAALPWSFPD